MVQRVTTVAFEGIEARAVDVQVQVAPGLPAFAIVRTIKIFGRSHRKRVVSLNFDECAATTFASSETIAADIIPMFSGYFHERRQFGADG